MMRAQDLLLLYILIIGRVVKEHHIFFLSVVKEHHIFFLSTPSSLPPHIVLPPFIRPCLRGGCEEE